MKRSFGPLLIALACGMAQTAAAGEKMGPLRADCPFGICSVTGQPRTGDTFFRLFNYLPESAGDVVPGTNIRVARPQKNPNVNKNIVQVTQADLDRLKNELRQRNQALLDDLARQIIAAVTATLDKLPGAKGLAAADREALQKAVDRGDPAEVAKLVPAADRNSPAAQSLTNLATARQRAERVRANIGDGNVRFTDLREMAAAINGTMPRDVLDAIGQVAVNIQMTVWVDEADVGNFPVPPGNGVPIALIPNLPPRMIIPLGPRGPVLVGAGPDIGNRIILGQGNVFQAAGLPAPVGPPVAEYDNEFYSGTVVLANVSDSPVRFVLDGYSQYPVTIQPRDVLNAQPGPHSVAFDRGGGSGNRNYRIGNGYYEFTPTDEGWDLFKATFTATVENPNDFAFNFVLNNQRYALGPGKATELTGEYPPIIRFEDGVGRMSRKQLVSGEYTVALGGDMSLDVYPASSIVMPKVNDTSSATVSVAVGATAGGSTSGGFKLPAGFNPIDPVELLTEEPKVVAEAPKLPAAFSLFAPEGGGN